MSLQHDPLHEYYSYVQRRQTKQLDRLHTPCIKLCKLLPRRNVQQKQTCHPDLGMSNMANNMLAIQPCRC